jgi:D-alanyl-D-alanine carboxypeptidase (penicillin-binding protein 5/6)
MMTERAKQMGCTGTNFTNPHGLHDPDHYTTARDLAIIAREAMKNEQFAKVARSEYRFIERSMNDEDVFLQTHNKFLKERPDATGIKTGWTVPAGRCFVGSAERDGLSVVTVVLKSTEWKEDSDVLADWAFDAWTASPIVLKGEVIASVPIKDADRVNVLLAAVRDFSIVRPRGEHATFSVVSKDIKLELPIIAGQPVGSVTLRDQDGVDHAMEVYSATDVKVAKYTLGGDPIGPSFVVIVAALIGGAWFVRRRTARI